MHHETYMRLYWEHYEAELEQLDGMWKSLGNGESLRVLLGADCLLLLTSSMAELPSR